MYNGKGCSPLGIVTWLENPILRGDRQVRHVAQAIIDDMDEYVASRVHGQDDVLDIPYDLVYIGHQRGWNCDEWTFGSNYEDGIDSLIYQEESAANEARWVIRTPFGGDRPITFDQAMRIAVNFHIVFVANGYFD